MGADSRITSSEPFWCQTLGGLALYRRATDRRPLMEAGKPLAVLAYVALTPEGRVPRDHVAELLWPDADLAEGRHSLRQALYRLRHATAGTPLLRLRGADVTMVAIVDFDCLEGERRAQSGDLPGALELLRGSFLDGFGVSESHEFETWAERHRVRFRDTWAGAARRMIERSLAEGNPADAQRAAEQLAAAYPFDDEVARLLMATLVGGGRHAAALAHYHTYTQHLREEMDAAPGQRLVAYVGEIESYIKSRPESSMQRLPFVGRARQWSALEAAWEGVRNGRGATVLIEGSAGLGKSRLIDELSQRVAGAGGIVLSAKCYDIERRVPYAAVADGLAPVVGRSATAGVSPAWLAEAARLLPELRERFTGLPLADEVRGSPAAKRRLHQAVARLLGAVAEDAPVVFVVDDMHWADEPSLELLHFLSHRLRDAPVLLIAAYRPAELSPVARQFARSLCGAKLADLLVLDPLTARDVADLLRAMGRFDDPATGEVVARHLERHTTGNPLFLNEVLDALGRRGLLRVRRGCWEIGAGAETAELPHTLGKLMADHIDSLAPWPRACLETLAVAAAETSVEELAEVLQVSEPRAELGLAVLHEDRLVRRGAAGGFELIHDELRRLLYQGIADDRRRLLHTAVGTALEARGEAKRPGGAARLAFHFDQAECREQAHRYALLAAGEAEALAAPGERRAHLALAEAHAPRALPPVARVRVPGMWGFVRRHGLVVVGAATMALLSVAAGYLFSPVVARPAYRQGTIYLGTQGVTAASHRLRWPARRGQLMEIEALRRAPRGDPPPLFTRRVSASNETHTKLFTVRGTDTAQLTFGLSDDMGPRWAPDGRHFMFARGWKTSETRYQQNLFVADSTEARAVTDSPWQDSYAVWSHDGTRIAFARDSAGMWSVWVVDADGGHPHDVTTHAGLPRRHGVPSFAPGDRELAVVYADTGSGRGAVYVVDLVEHGLRPVVGSVPGMFGGMALWSPDARWVAYVVRRGGRHVLSAVPATEPGIPVVLADFPEALEPVRWTGGRSRFVETVALESTVVTVAIGRGTRVPVRVRAQDGNPMPAVVRWSVGDSAIALVDERGFVRGRRAGTTVLVASAGGARADTGAVVVTAEVPDILLVEDWESGLDTTRWIPFGYPTPKVVSGVPPDGRAVFWNNGDYNHGSGAVSAARFLVGTEALTVETEAWLRSTGGHWQIWQIGWDDDPWRGGPEVSSAVSLNLQGPEPGRAIPVRSCAGSPPHTEEPLLSTPQWIAVAMTVRPDGWVECWVGGRLVGARPVPDSLVDRPLALVLRGHSVGTEVYHGKVVVRRGVVY